MSYAYRARTQKRIEKISQEALTARENGITKLREEISSCANTVEREHARNLIAAMNYSVSQVQRELRERRKQDKRGK